MRIVLRITTLANNVTMREFIGGPAESHYSRVLGIPRMDGKRNVLTIPVAAGCADTREDCERKAIEHLLGFGFAREDIDVQYKRAPGPGDAPITGKPLPMKTIPVRRVAVRRK